MSNSIPHISVLMPVYNAEKYIYEAVASVLQQTFESFELLIINDGSTDDTLNIINQFNDNRIVVHTQTNHGVAAALNKGLHIARAPYIVRFDADDICYPDRLQLQYDFMEANPDYTIIGSAADYIDADGYYLFTHKPAAFTYGELQQLPYHICPFIHSTICYRRDAILKKGGYNELAHTFEDHFLWACILSHEKACNMPQPLIKVRLNPESVTIDERWHSSAFLSIKKSALKSRTITDADSQQLKKIAGKRVSNTIKEGAYYAVCGKKYLLNNYQPQKARLNIRKAINLHPYRWDNYLLYIMSFLPEPYITWLNTNIKQIAQR